MKIRTGTARAGALAGASLALAVMLFLFLAGTTGQAVDQSTPSQGAPAAGAQTTGAPAGRGGGGNNREPDPMDFEDHEGFTQMFDGTTLTNWDGNPDVWKVVDGAIVGESTREKPAGNTFIVYKATEAKDFDLKLEAKVEFGGGSGIQYRSSLGLGPNANNANTNAAANAAATGAPAPPPRNPRWTMIGPQMDFWLPLNPNNSRYTGQLYSQNNGRGILTWRGQVAQFKPGKATGKVVGNVGDRAALGGYYKFNDWNQLTMIVRGGTFIHILNGQLLAVQIDDDPASSNNVSGLIGLQIEGTPCRISFRNLWLKKLS